MQISAQQHTLKNSIRATGVGLHTGKQINIVLRPGSVDSGIIFRRIDLDYDYRVSAHATMWAVLLWPQRSRMAPMRFPLLNT